ncbi:RNA polymerase subunit sigma-24 [Wenjunlia vitaminophila]|uniref:RNA polymerase subunit sigma-24 n=1 Tax=Wenjunlia vitaminophila TaxID=76728 RepID=A0A0T6LRH1_WENVI|nr:SigE family RNA polymerase sigma factor [Wenjunlia vitaminophila]KRV48645.1 RNA polymerase subunit sigma-24 [Wenjunlia vitaminophila]
MLTRNQRGGDADFTEFTAARWPYLVRMAHMLTGDFHEAEDLVQTTLIKVYAQWPRVRRDEADLYVRRALINNNRSRHRRRRVAHLLTPFLPDTPGGSGRNQHVEQREVLMEALAALPQRQRAVIVLRYWEDLSEQDTARTLGCSVGTVKSQASRALTKLRAHPALTGFALVPPGEPT